MPHYRAFILGCGVLILSGCAYFSGPSFEEGVDAACGRGVLDDNEVLTLRRGDLLLMRQGAYYIPVLLASETIYESFPLQVSVMLPDEDRTFRAPVDKLLPGCRVFDSSGVVEARIVDVWQPVELLQIDGENVLVRIANPAEAREVLSRDIRLIMEERENAER